MPSLNSIFALTVLLACFASDVRAGCTPDYRADKNSGAFIQDFVIGGTTSIDSGDLERVRNKLLGACVDEQNGELEQLVRAAFQNEGYYAALVKNLETHTIDPLARPKTIAVEAEVVEGPIFKIGRVNFVGNHTFSAAELLAALSLRKGEVVRRSSIANGFDGIRQLYLPKGFGDLMFVPDDVPDLGTSRVNLTLTISEGPQYRMGKLVIAGKHDDLSARLQSAWSISEGTIFDFSYPDEYIKSNRESLSPSFSKTNLQIVKNCPEASVVVILILDESALFAQDFRPPRPVGCKEPGVN